MPSPFLIIQSFLPFSILLCFGSILSSCGDQPEIRFYEIPSEYIGPVVSWDIPEEWGEDPDLFGPMAGSFHVKTDLGPMGKIGVMAFRESVSNVDLANTLGMELGQASMDEEKLKEISEIKMIGGREFEWIRLSDRGNNGATSTLLLALHRNKGETWLFPFIGDRDLIREQEKNFESFLASTTLRAGKVEIRAKAPVLPPPLPQDIKGAPTWKIPKHWVKTSVSSMRLASYEVTDGNNSKLDFSVTSFPGYVGGTLANVNRWLGQIGIDPVQEVDLEKYISPITLDEKEAQLVVAEGKTESLFAATLVLEDRSWFFKLTGNRELAKVEKSNFLSVLESVCFH